jgi:tripartite-type tricarboxylate transporter receptor subunit TctC
MEKGKGALQMTSERPKDIYRNRLIRADVLAFALVLAACGQAVTGGGEEAPDFPNRAIEYVVPYSAGGGTDTAARMMSPALSTVVDVPVNVQIRSGGAGATGSLYVIGEPADGYTLLAGENGIMTTGPLAMEEPPYDPATDLLGVCSFTADPWVLTVNAESGISTVEDFVARSEEPEAVSIGITAVLSADHYALLLLQQAMDFPTYRTVAYGGGGPKSLAVLGGEVDAMMETADGLVSGVEEGLLVPLMVLSEERLEAYPDVPTSAEAGFEGVVADTWQAINVRRDTPAEIVGVLEQACEEAYNDPGFQENMASLGARLLFRDSAEIDALMTEERTEALSIIEQIETAAIETKESE